MPTDIDDQVDSDLLRSAMEDLIQEDLEPTTPDEALEMYERIREDEVTESTMNSHRSRLSFFIDWCKEAQIDNLNELTGRDLHRFRSWREQGLSLSTLETNLRTLRIFLRKCEKFDAVHSELPEKVDIPSVSSDENSRDDMVSGEQAKVILDHLDKYDYGSTEHVVWTLIAAAGLRLGAVRCLDLSDYTPADDGGEVELAHRPASDTPLKNKTASERTVHLSEYVGDVLDDYIADRRPSVTDEYGREPLVASDYGRLHQSTVRKYVYMWTRPCVTTGDCPHGKTIDECEAAATANNAYQCPSSTSPHSARRGYITHELASGIPKAVVSDRCDVSEGVIDDHYDERTDREKMELRKQIREEAYENSNSNEYYQ